ncbi:type II toxin-antitoxin system PemK/MazF family toxin [Candidatus Nomurabacteria bacterium]|nr:type II toxin-antitoxin system PemK/MazF family toxin [Candidatus Nomurabacteria bacterium]
MAALKPRRGEVWWVNFNPTIGTEVQKQRPAIIVSNDISNKFLDRVQVVPLTSNTEKVYPSEALVTVKKQAAKAMTDQIRTVSVERLGKKISSLTAIELVAVELVLRMQLGL